jgi:hypothetical protein
MQCYAGDVEDFGYALLLRGEGVSELLLWIGWGWR